MDPLGELHLILREHGWEPRFHSKSGYWTFWKWARCGCDKAVVTAQARDPNVRGPRWAVVAGGAWRSLPREPMGTNPAALRRRLKQLTPAIQAGGVGDPPPALDRDNA